jgi:hypothetical protein
MAKWVQLTDVYGQPVYVNAEEVAYVSFLEKNRTNLYFGGI